MPQSPLGPYQIEAFNTAKDSENKIHDDAVARRFGFKGGLVPGVEVYAYMTHLPVARWGRAWLERGTAECRLLKPVYDGDTVTVTRERNRGRARSAPRQPRRAVRHRPRRVAGRAIAAPADLRRGAGAAEPARRPAAGRRDDARRSGPGSRSIRSGSTPRRRSNICATCARACRSMPTRGWSIPARSCTSAIGRCATMSCLGPWMHVGSRIEHFAAARIGDELVGPRARHRQLRAARATASSISTCWSMPTARPRSPASPTSRSTARASSPPREIDGRTANSAIRPAVARGRGSRGSRPVGGSPKRSRMRYFCQSRR